MEFRGVASKYLMVGHHFYLNTHKKQARIYVRHYQGKLWKVYAHKTYG